MQCIKCKTSPVNLTHFIDQNDKKPRPKLATPIINCYGCGTIVNTEIDPMHHCLTCNAYSLCDDCRFCDNGHALTKATYLE